MTFACVRHVQVKGHRSNKDAITPLLTHISLSRICNWAKLHSTVHCNLFFLAKKVGDFEKGRIAMPTVFQEHGKK